MNTAAPTLSPLFRSDAQAEILARLLLNCDRRYTTTELARLCGVPYATAHRETQRLVQAGLLVQERIGRAVQLRANADSPLFPPLVEILRLTYGPAAVLPRVLAGVDGVEEAYIYGSWAARRAGEAGDAPGDIDVLVVGTPSRSAVAEAAEAAESVLGRDVNIRIVSTESWHRGEDLFVKTVRDRPLARLNLSLEDSDR